MTNAEPKAGMPKWLKIVLIVGGVFVVGTVGLMGALFFVGATMVKDAQDPAKIKQVVSTFMTVKEPLPDGYEYKLGADLFGNKIVALNNSDKDLKIVIGDLKQVDDLNDPEKVINKLSQHSNAAGQGGRSNVKFVSEKKGSETVGGRKMDYAIGKAVDDKTQRTTQVFIGLFEPTEQGTVAIFGSTSKEKYDMEGTDTFLKAIEKI
ncbi:MAG: hypothetical protein P4L53_10120 [Candidatus Obscuribacterales bacterium]|nr:hypothetical protein [Candidatus Obscuribacterales bacterium]